MDVDVDVDVEAVWLHLFRLAMPGTPFAVIGAACASKAPR